MDTSQLINESTNQRRSSAWREMREKNAFLALEDGTVFRGYSVGAPKDAVGEVVFNTGMSGYQEILSDPSYAGQFVTMTYPEIGNYGINSEDRESRKFFLNGLIVHDLNEPSNWRSEQSLRDALIKQGVPAVAGIDTRALTSLLRDKGTLKGYLCVGGNIEHRTSNIERPTEEEAVKTAQSWEGLDGQDYAARVTCDKEYDWKDESLPPADLKMVCYDFGVKWNILRSLRRNGIDVTVVPAQTPARDVLAKKPDGVFLSNGPADPAAVKYAIKAAKELIGKVPLMGICLGHQILGHAVGGKTVRLKFGHHGCNHPVMDLETRKVEITSQNHNFSLDKDSVDPKKVEITHINLNDNTVEGLRHRTEPVFSVQYHPEACPGPHDPYYLFKRFRDIIERA